jgi:hypothetical protein
MSCTLGHIECSRGCRPAAPVCGGSCSGIVTAIRACGLADGSLAKGMTKISYAGYRFPPETIQKATCSISDLH